MLIPDQCIHLSRAVDSKAVLIPQMRKPGHREGKGCSGAQLERGGTGWSQVCGLGPAKNIVSELEEPEFQCDLP